ncbi:MAG: ImmA/IrrE family metallo-endopeptidase [Candidatus Tectomicrobia bacterium]|nr:ImmA/IrrE family metallo-endopeptidase [Candidatus Tectomicrobia bacterium]
MTRVSVNAEILRWAQERAGLTQDDLIGKFSKLPEWESGSIQPTLKQAEAFARTVHIPVGYLFLAQPPEEPVPIPDFRTISGQAVKRPSPNLLDMIYACQERQGWYRDFLRVTQEPELDFVGSATIDTPPVQVAAHMREAIDFNVNARRECPTWADALRLFARQAEEAGILVMTSGIVLSNTSRRLDPAEFRGFALSDPLAPLIFINGADTKAAQMFTLAHELAHLWLGASALSNIGAESGRQGYRPEEIWCNAVAAELLVPLDDLHKELRDEEPSVAVPRLARAFKVSALVILRRLLDANRLDRPSFDSAWEQAYEQLRDKALAQSGGGNFYRTTLARVGVRFARALVASTLEGQTLYRDAYRMLGISKTATFDKLGREAGVSG